MPKRKEKELSIAELDKKLSVMPHTSQEYLKVLEKIQKRERNIYGDQHILAVYSNRLKENSIKTKFLTNTEEYENLCGMMEFDCFYEFNMTSEYFPRYMIEHDYRYKQVLTFGYITNPARNLFVLLRKKDSNRLGMIGGHTDFTLEAYSTTPTEFLIKNLLKEIDEEVKITNLDTTPFVMDITAKMFVNENDDSYNLRNVGFIYEIMINVPQDDLEKYFKFESNEPKNHTVEIVTMEEIINSKRSHSMLKYIPRIIENEM